MEDDDTLAKRIGERIAARVDRLEIELASLAQALDVTKDSAYKWMRGEAVVQWVKLAKLARHLRTTPNVLLGFEDGNQERLERLLIAAFEGIGCSPDQARNYAQTFLEALDKPQDPQAHVSVESELRIEIAFAKRLSERP